jgi:amino acid transporter
MRLLSQFKELVVGKPLNALNPKIKEHIALISIIAWIGLGADGLSSSAYGPEEAFIALGTHTSVAIYIAIATVITVFLISLSYSQVIELFPNGGGGYKAASSLLGAKLGMISGSALIIDYILTIAVSTASGIDAIFSLIPPQFSYYKVLVELGVITLLITLNLRGVKESIYVLGPIFLGFLVTHITLISFGIYFHHSGLSNVLPEAHTELHSMTHSIGLIAVIAIVLRSFSLGGGTYTGLESVSNNVNILAEPRVRTGKLTMLYMAISLSFVASGIIILYLLWHAVPIENKTLNAVVFNSIINSIGMNHQWLTAILFFEAALLFVGANTGFVGCSSVMANMAVDKWLPRQFRELSNRLVTQNGILMCGIAAGLILIWADGKVSILVVLYSINVFLTFSMSLLGLSKYWIQNRDKKKWYLKLIITTIGFMVCATILIITTVVKFTEGAWFTIIITSIIIILCALIKRHYKKVEKKLQEAEIVFADKFNYDNHSDTTFIPVENKAAKTAVFFVSKHYGAGLHTILSVKRMFPNVFTNFVFLTSGEIDSESLSTDEIYKSGYRRDLNSIIDRYRLFCTKHDLPSDGLFSYGVDEAAELIKLSAYIEQDYSDCVFFASKLIFVDENWWSRILHNNTVTFLQHKLHIAGRQMVILPMKI